MKLGIGIGVEYFRGGSLAAAIASAFAARVATDGGTFEANSCLVSQINSLLNLTI